MDRQTGNLAADLYGTHDPVAGQIHHLQTATDECAFLRDCEPQELILEERVGDEQFVRQPYKCVEQGRLAKIYQATAVTDDDPHDPGPDL